LFDLGKEKQEPQVALNLVPHVYAASLSAARGQPAWISQPPNDENNLYFIGVGGDTLLEKAKQLAHDDAVARAVGYLSHQFDAAQQQRKEVDSAALSEFVVKFAEEADTYVDYDTQNSAYRYYVLKRMHREAVEENIAPHSIQ